MGIQFASRRATCGKIFIILVSGLPVWRVGEPQWGPSGIPVASHSIFDTSIFQKLQKYENLHETGRRGSKINISGIKMHNFFVPELMAAAVLVKTSVFAQLLMIFVAVA